MGRSLSKYTFPLYTDSFPSGPGGSSGLFNGVYLLDIFTDATVGYSLRQLRTGVTKCVRVRRSSDNAQQDFGFVRDYLDVDSLLTFVGGGDGFVTTWYDQSTNALNATEATTARQPQIVFSGAISLINGKANIAFNQKRLGLLPTSLLTDSGGLWQAFMVVFFAATSGSRGVWCADSSSRLGRFGFAQNLFQAAEAFDSVGNAFFDFDTVHPVSLNTQYLLSTIRRSNNVEIFTNTVSDGPAATTGTPAVFTIDAAIGSLNSTGSTTGALIGNLQEIIHFPTADDTKRVKVRDAINNYYKIF